MEKAGTKGKLMNWGNEFGKKKATKLNLKDD